MQIKKLVPSAASGFYTCSGDNPFTASKLTVYIYCDMVTDRGGWMVIQRRNASLDNVNFFRNWDDYENGFGDIDEFWIGLKNIHEFTTQKDTEMHISAWNSRSLAKTFYPFVVVGDANTNYKIYKHAGTGDGYYGPSPQYDSTFSTFDRDEDDQ